MEVAQMLPDGGISITWVLGIMTVVLGYLINNKLGALEKTLEAHGADIQAIKISQAKSSAEYQAAIQRIDHMDQEFEELKQLIQSKIRFVNGDE